MRALAIFLLLALPIGAAGQTFDDVLEGLGEILERSEEDLDGTNIASLTYLDAEITSARAEGRLTPDWSVFFAMLSDGARNVLERPAYALQVAEEGLALSADGDDYFFAALMASRAYALADLERLDEAVQAMILALPGLEENFPGDVQSYRDHLAAWQEGSLSDWNISAFEIGQAALNDALSARLSGDPVRAIILASAAMRPDPPTDAYRWLNARAELLIGQAHSALNDDLKAFQAHARGLEQMTSAPIMLDAPPAWAFPLDERARRTAFLLFEAAAVAASNLEETSIAIYFAEAGRDLAANVDEEVDINSRLAWLYFFEGEHDRGAEMLTEAAALADAEGDGIARDRALFDLERQRAILAAANGTAVDADALVSAMDALISHQSTRDSVDELSFALELLDGTGAHAAQRDISERLVAAALAKRETVGSTGFAERAGSRAVREAIETQLGALLDIAASGGDDRVHVHYCDPEDLVGLCVMVRRPR